MEKNLGGIGSKNFSFLMKSPLGETTGSHKHIHAYEEQIHGMTEVIDEGYVEIDLNGTITYCNGAACSMLGYPREMLLGMSNRKISTRESYRRMNAVFKEIFRTGLTSAISDYEITRRDGSIAPVAMSAGLMTDLDACPTGFNFIMRGDRPKTIADTDLILKSYAVEKSIIAIAILDPSRAVSYVNDAFLRMWGHEEGDRPSGAPFMEIFHPDDRKCIEEMMDTLDELGNWVGELTLKKRDGSQFFIILSASVIRNELGRDIGTIVSFVDISLRKKIDVALKEKEQKLSLHNEFMTKEMQIAQRAVNDIINTSLPRIDSIRMDFRHRPMNQIGGDFFSFYPYGRDSVGVFICDISGHGVASSLYLSLVKSIADRLAHGYGRSPVDYLTRLNQELVGHISSYFITGIYGLLAKDLISGRVLFSYSNGGHPGPILVTREGRIKLHSLKSTLIGISNDIAFNSSTIPLDPGDRLFLYTDGIPETANRSREMIGYDYHLLDLFTKSSHLTLGENLDAIIDRVDAFRDGEDVTDDILIIGFEAET